MGLVVEENKTKRVEKFEVTERLYTDAEGNIVPEDSPEAAFLYSTPGKRIPLTEAIEKGLAKKGDKPAPEPEPVPESGSEPEPESESEKPVEESTDTPEPAPEPAEDPNADLKGLKRPELDKLAKSLAIDLDALEGTGKDGNVVNNDVKDAIVKARADKAGSGEAKKAEPSKNKQGKTAQNKGA